MHILQTQIILSTTRLQLRTWQISDIPLMAAISSDAKVMEYFPYIQDLATTQRFVEDIQHHQATYGYSLYATVIKDTQQFIGFVGLKTPSFTIPHFTPAGLPIMEIGWRLAAQHWDQGYASETAAAALEYAFLQLKLPEVISFTVANNMRSRRVMEKIGLQHNPADDFDHPKLDPASPLCRHVLYRLTRAQYLLSHT